MYSMLYFFLKVLSFFPLKLLYLLSDVLTFLLQKVLKYRIEIVKEHFKKAFPKKDSQEISELIKKFYQSFCDQWIETIKSLSWNKDDLLKYIEGDLSVFNESKITFVFLGHQFNWELANLYAGTQAEKPFAGMYLPITSKAMNQFFLTLRSRTGATLIPADDFRTHLKNLSKNDFTLSFIADQNPGALEHAHWINFFNQKTPFLKTPFRMAKIYQAQVVFAQIVKMERGRYKIVTSLLAENAADHSAEKLVELYGEALERAIHEQPENWLWTHKRWKHADKYVEYNNLNK